MRDRDADKSWYDYPAYYDLAMRSETPLEADFIEAACRKYCPFPARRLLEPACGTGRLVAEMAARGYAAVGFDLNESALAYLRRRLARRGLRGEVFAADMADFTLAEPVDAAYNTFDSFRHLLDEQSAQRHLECVAASLRPGGIYILGLHLLPPDADLECTERWTARTPARGLRLHYACWRPTVACALSGCAEHVCAARGKAGCACAMSFPCECTRPISSAAYWPPCLRWNSATCMISGMRSTSRSS